MVRSMVFLSLLRIFSILTFRCWASFSAGSAAVLELMQPMVNCRNGSVEPEDYVNNWNCENQDAYILNLNRRRCESGELDGNQLTDKTLTDR